MPIPRPRPELMVVGDSVAQGIRSLSINHEFASYSYPKLIADCQGWDFRVPDFPRPVLFDLEEEARKLSVGSILKLNRRLEDNLKGWQQDLVGSGRPSRQRCFDNLAIGGVNMEEFHTFKAGDLRSKVADNISKALQESVFKKFSILTNLHLQINGCFTLNPSKNPDYDGFTQMDWVRQRKPKRLFYHCGHNDGIYKVGSEGKALDLRRSTLSKNYLDRLKELDRLPREIGTIVVFLFPKLSAVANLMPIGPIVDGYARQYETQFPFRWNRISGKAIRKIDDDLKWMNWRIRQTIAQFKSEPRFRVIETYEVFEKYDFKNLGGNERLVTSGSQTIDNRYLHWQRRPRRPRRGNRPRGRVKVTWEHGGFQSLDGMHPTGIGYAVLAKEVMKALNLSYDKDSLMKAAFKRERTGGLTRGLRGYDDFDNLLETLDAIVPDGQASSFSPSNLIGIGHQSRL